MVFLLNTGVVTFLLIAIGLIALTMPNARIVDAREELCREFAFPVLQWQAKYESIYLLGTSIARPLISQKCQHSRT